MGEIGQWQMLRCQKNADFGKNYRVAENTNAASTGVLKNSMLHRN